MDVPNHQDKTGFDTAAPKRSVPENKTTVKKRLSIPKESQKILRKWLACHLNSAYPGDKEKLRLATETNLTLVQISNWFINARRRYLPKMKSLKESQNTPNTTPQVQNLNRSSDSDSSIDASHPDIFDNAVLGKTALRLNQNTSNKKCYNAEHAYHKSYNKLKIDNSVKKDKLLNRDKRSTSDMKKTVYSSRPKLKRDLIISFVLEELHFFDPTDRFYDFKILVLTASAVRKFDKLCNQKLIKF